MKWERTGSGAYRSEDGEWTVTKTDAGDWRLRETDIPGRRWWFVMLAEAMRFAEQIESENPA